MSINLEKGQKVDLTKTNPGINAYALGLGWSENANVGSAFDLDASAFILGANKKRLSDKHFVFYGNLESPEKAVIHSGDNLTGAGDGDDETITVDFSKLPQEAEEIVLVVTIYQAQERSQNFGQVSDAFIRIYDPATNVELMKYDLGEDFSLETAVEFGRLYKKDGEWKFNATGVGRRGGLQEYLNEF
jgi:tellurium resistance protein TerD